VECGRRAGVKTIQVLTGYGADQFTSADYRASDAVEAIEIVLNRTRV
jgi:hypothetical protein